MGKRECRYFGTLGSDRLQAHLQIQVNSIERLEVDIILKNRIIIQTLPYPDYDIEGRRLLDGRFLRELNWLGLNWVGLGWVRWESRSVG